MDFPYYSVKKINQSAKYLRESFIRIKINSAEQKKKNQTKKKSENSFKIVLAVS